MSKSTVMTASTDRLMEMARDVALSVSPSFALDRFVAVNPFANLARLDFAAAAELLRQTNRGKMTPAWSELQQAVQTGKVTAADIEAALLAAGQTASPGAVEAVRLALAAPEPAASPALPTIATLYEADGGTGCSSFVIDHLSQFCAGAAAGHYGPFELFGHWQNNIAVDRAVEFAGYAGVREQLAALPAQPAALLTKARSSLALSDKAFGLYLHRLLADVSGWAAFWRGRIWDSDQNAPGAALDLLLMRLGWDLAIALAKPTLVPTLLEAAEESLATSERSALDVVLQGALEAGWQRAFFAKLADAGARQVKAPKPRMQAVFCIDVRSEPFRRALEAQDDYIETFGFAGFFGLPLRIETQDGLAGAAHCPVLIQPAVVAKPTKTGAAMGSGLSSLFDTAARHPLASLGFVESFGLTYVAKHVTASFAGRGRTGAAGESNALYAADGTELDLAARAKLAAGMLRGIGLTGELAEIVVLVGHTASTTNNAHAASLDCGACGGHSGEASASVAAQLLNDSGVRTELRKLGTLIPDTTLFVAGLHDTTRNVVTLLGKAADTRLAQVEFWFAGAAAAVTAAPGRPHLPGSGEDRSRDWSAVRPEWGLAGCAAFIAGPRQATRHADLRGEAFLHSYEWQKDEGFAVLETILTAPLIVASWINLQYFAATLDNDRFGGGNKLLHNVVAGMGVIEGAGGDLRPGLPMQSVHDGQQFVHTPLRLTALIEAPREAIGRVIDSHAHLRDLLRHGWISLFQTTNGVVTHRFSGHAGWVAIGEGVAELAA